MAYLYWTLAVAYALAAFITITQVGKPREPLRGGAAAIAVSVAFVNIAALIYAALHI